MPELISSVPPPPENSPKIAVRAQIREFILTHLNYQGGSDRPKFSEKFPDGTVVHVFRNYKSLSVDEDSPVFDANDPEWMEDLNQQIARMETMNEEIILLTRCNGEPVILRASADGPYELPGGPTSTTRKRVLDITSPEQPEQN